MADDDDDIDVEDDEDGGGGGGDDEGSSGGGKKKLIIILAALLLLLGGAAGAAYFMGLHETLLAMLGADPAVEEVEEQPLQQAVFIDLPEILVNLNTTGRKKTYLKITVSLELPKPEDIPTVEMMQPRITDKFQVYLRELRMDDLQGAQGMYRLRSEMLARVNASLASAKVEVSDVLFKEMLIQ